MPNRYFSIISIALLSIVFSCGKPAVENHKPIIAVSIPPQKYFVEKIADGLFDVIVMIPPGASPHTYEPRPSQMIALSKATLYFSIGLEFEKAWLKRLNKSYPQMTFVAADSGIEKISMEDCGHGDHGSPGSLDPHIWLAPALVRQQAATITRALCKIDPAHAALFTANDSLFGFELSAMHDTIRQILAHTKQGRPFLVFHPSWGYFAKEFGLRQISIEVEGKEPTPGELSTTLALARSSGIKTIYVQPQFSRRTVQIIANELGAHVMIADPLALDWKMNLLQCARALEEH
jgi:zinc transport system substrate-binding protein